MPISLNIQTRSLSRSHLDSLMFTHIVVVDNPALKQCSNGFFTFQTPSWLQTVFKSAVYSFNRVLIMHIAYTNSPNSFWSALFLHCIENFVVSITVSW